MATNLRFKPPCKKGIEKPDVGTRRVFRLAVLWTVRFILPKHIISYALGYFKYMQIKIFYTQNAPPKIGGAYLLKY